MKRPWNFGANGSAAENLALCEKLVRDNKGNTELDGPSLKALHELMIKEQRTTQDAPIAALLGLGHAAIDARLKALFDEWRKLSGWEKRPERLRLQHESDGTLMLDLGGLPITDLTVLKGLPISILQIGGTKVEDLTPLTGFRLVGFDAHVTSISDLAPLRGMPLRSIEIGSCPKVEDLSPLAGMPLEHCGLSRAQVADFSPLKLCPIKELTVSETRITTLDAFAGMPSERLIAASARALVDISAVRTMRLRFVSFNASKGIRDLSPLADCPDLEEIDAPSEGKNVASLRRLAKLRSIHYGEIDRCSPEELWVKLGIGDDRDRVHVALIQKARAAMAASGMVKSDPNWVKALPDGTLDLAMAGAACRTLVPLRGLPVSVLDINNSSVTDLSPLADMPMRRLKMFKTKIVDLSPLANCRKLESLWCWDSGVRDLSPLAGLPLVEFESSPGQFSSIAPLAGMPLKIVALNGTLVTDLHPLLSCPTIEWLTIPVGAKSVGELRALKHLVRISERWDHLDDSPHHDGAPAQTAEEFWKEYDAKKARSSR